MKLIFLADIDIKGSPNVRADIRPEVVEEYTEAYKAKVKMPPIDVFKSGKDYLLADGWHRVEAVRKLGRKVIEAIEHTGSKTDALKFALSANTAHGLRRSTADKRRCIALALAEWAKLSDNELGKICAVDHKTVAEVRKDLEGMLKIPKVETRTDSTGRSQPSAKPKGETLGNSQRPKEPKIITDAIGYPIPKNLIPLWERREEAQELLTTISRIKVGLEKKQKEKDPLYHEVVFASAITDLKNVFTNLANSKPYTVCSSCQGRVMNKTCALCGGSGFISEFRWNRAVPEEERAIRMKGLKK